MQNSSLEDSIGEGLQDGNLPNMPNFHHLPKKKKKIKLKNKRLQSNDDTGYYSNIDPNIEAMKIVQEQSRGVSYVKAPHPNVNQSMLTPTT